MTTTPSEVDVSDSSDSSDSSAAASVRRGPIVLLSVLLLALAAAALVAAVMLRSDNARDNARVAAITAARQEALNLTSIDGQAIDADLQRVLDGATGGFKTDFAQRSKDLKKGLTDNHVVAAGQVIDAALVRADDQTATALVVVDSNVKNKAAPAGRSNTYRMQLDLELHAGRWLTSALQFVG